MSRPAVTTHLRAVFAPRVPTRVAAPVRRLSRSHNRDVLRATVRAAMTVDCEHSHVRHSNQSVYPRVWLSYRGQTAEPRFGWDVRDVGPVSQGRPTGCRLQRRRRISVHADDG